MAKQLLGEIMVGQGYISPLELEEALRRQKNYASDPENLFAQHLPIGQILLRCGSIDEPRLATALFIQSDRDDNPKRTEDFCELGLLECEVPIFRWPVVGLVIASVYDCSPSCDYLHFNRDEGENNEQLAERIAQVVKQEVLKELNDDERRKIFEDRVSQNTTEESSTEKFLAQYDMKDKELVEPEVATDDVNDGCVPGGGVIID